MLSKVPTNDVVCKNNPSGSWEHLRTAFLVSLFHSSSLAVDHLFLKAKKKKMPRLFSPFLQDLYNMQI